jgi:hypothetical protein
LDIGMSHELLKGRQGDSVANHIRTKAMTEPVRIGAEYVTAQTVVSKKRPESGCGHGLSAVAAL